MRPAQAYSWPCWPCGCLLGCDTANPGLDITAGGTYVDCADARVAATLRRPAWPGLDCPSALHDTSLVPDGQAWRHGSLRRPGLHLAWPNSCPRPARLLRRHAMRVRDYSPPGLRWPATNQNSPGQAPHPHTALHAPRVRPASQLHCAACRTQDMPKVPYAATSTAARRAPAACKAGPSH